MTELKNSNKCTFFSFLNALLERSYGGKYPKIGRASCLQLPLSDKIHIENDFCGLAFCSLRFVISVENVSLFSE